MFVMMINKIKEVLLMLILGILQTKCSVVIDRLNYRNGFTDKYCKHVGVCEQGTHVVCTHYDPNRVMGPRCAGTREVNMTQEYVDFILNVMNDVRSRVANGRAVGYNRLPRGYGIFRLEYDHELAMLAQIWANQCVVDYDVCHATSSHPDPGQIFGKAQFLEPEWTPLTKKKHFEHAGFSQEKVNYGVEAVLERWYKSRDDIDSDIVLGLERQWPENVLRNEFLQIIQGSATHVGCGISVFQHYEYDERHLIYNVVFLVCNFSNRIVEHRGVYNSEPRTEVGFTIKCGCPLGYDEDVDCLCIYTGRGLPYTCRYGSCKPNVVIVPVITVEDAPAQLLKNSSNLETRKKLMPSKDLIHLEHDTHSRKNTSRSSIFTKSSIFQLPSRKKTLPKDSSVIKKDVKSRKNFENLTNIVTNYLNKKRGNINSDNTHSKNYVVDDAVDDFFKLKEDDLSVISTTEYPIKRFVVKVQNKESDNILVNLLQKLEDETKDIQIPYTEKDAVDNKIKNIYGTLVEKFHFHGSNSNENNRSMKFNEYSHDVRVRDPKRYLDNERVFVNNEDTASKRKTFDLHKYSQPVYAETGYDYNDEDNGLISLDRKQFYQNKLNNLGRVNYDVENYYRDGNAS